MDCAIKAKILAAVVNAMADMREEMTFKFQLNGLDIRQVDTSHTIGIQLFLPKEAWESYTPFEEPFMLSVKEMKAYLRRLSGADVLVFKGDLKKESSLLMGIRGAQGFRRFGLAVMQVDEEHKDPPEIKLFSADVKAKVSVPALVEAVADAEVIVGDSGAFNIEARSKPERLVVWTSEEGTFRSSWYEFQSKQSLLGMECIGEKIRSQYGIPQIKAVLSASGVSNIVWLGFAEDFPIKFVYQLAFPGILEFFMAPRIEPK